MATTESVSASSGPRYAPEDPTLPKPWLGLIDGSNGTDCLYYWNPETNITQYEKPAALPPPLPPGPPPSTPKLAQIPTAHSAQMNGFLAPGTQSQGQHVGQVPQQYGHGVQQQSVVQFSSQQGSPYGQPVQQSMQMRPQLMQYPGQQMSQQPGQGMQQQVVQQTSYQASSHQNAQMVQGPNVYQQQQYMGFQQGMVPQGQQNSQQTQIGAQGFQYYNQPDYKVVLSSREESDYQKGKQTSFSPSQFQQTGGASSQTISTGNNTVRAPPAGVLASNTHQYSSSAVDAQKPGQFQLTETDCVHQQHGPQFQNQTHAPMVHNQQSNVSHVGFKPGYENNMRSTSGNNYHYNAKMEGSVMSPPQSQPAANSMEPGMGTAGFQNAPTGFSGGFNPSGHPTHMYGHAVGGPPPNNALARPPLNGMQDIPNVSAAELYRREHEVTATGDNVPAPIMTFEATGFPPEILIDIHAAGFLSPTPIQAQTWPIALQSKDIVAIAKTGSGKTLGYLIPAFILLRQLRNNPQMGPSVVILAPTRELATQIQEEVIKFGRSSRVSCTCLYGGAPKGPQLRELDRGADIVVATPGRLNDILEMKKIDFRQVSLLVLDEADRMLDMGFEPQIRKIVNEIPPRRQTLMYTATWPKEVRKIANDLLVNPVQVNIGSVDELAANKSITQYVEVIPQMEKDRRLEQILRAQERGSKVIIFCSTKRLCDQLARGIGRNFGALAIHGNKSQNERDWVLNQFRSGKSPILVATDVAARGLDIKDIRAVINYDFPTGIEDYVHRIGRTGRAGATGVSYTFFSEQDWKYAADLVKVLEGANQLVPPEVREMALRGGPGFGRDRGGMGIGRSDSVGGRWDSGGRGGMRDGGFGGRGGMKDGGFGGRGVIRDGNYGGRGGMRDGGFGGRGGGRDSPFGGRGGRGDSFLGHGNRGRGFGGPAGGNVGWGRSERETFDRHNMDGRGRGRGRGRFDGRRDAMDRSRGRSFSRSPDKVRTWDHSRSRSRSRSWSRSRSRSWSRSRSRSRTPRHSRSRSPRRNRSRSPRRNRSYSRSPRPSRSYSRSPEQKRSSRSPRRSGFDILEKPGEMNYEKEAMVPKVEAPGEPIPVSEMSPMSPGTHGNTFSEQIRPVGDREQEHPEATTAAGPPSLSET